MLNDLAEAMKALDGKKIVPDTSLGKADPPRMQRFRTVEKDAMRPLC